MTDQTDEYLQSRADAMQSIEGTIVELGGIFQQLAHMIKEQEEIMVRKTLERNFTSISHIKWKCSKSGNIKFKFKFPGEDRQ